MVMVILKGSCPVVCEKHIYNSYTYKDGDVKMFLSIYKCVQSIMDSSKNY